MSTDGKKSATEVGEVVASKISDSEKDYIRRQRFNRYQDPYYGRYARNQPGSEFYDPTTSTPYYGMTQKPMRGRDTAIFAGMGLLGTGIERYLRSQEADTAGVRYAEQQLAQAQADLKAPTPKMSSEEKADMVQAAVAPVRTEIEEIKSDVGSYLASTGRTASVEDVVAAREAGTQALADAPIHAAAVAADKDLKMLQMDEAKKAAAQARADNMVAVLDKVELQQMKYDQAMWGDITKVAFTATANAVAQDNRPAYDRLRERGASMQDLEILHQKAVAAGYPRGSREYNNYMMKEYHGLTSKKKQRKGKKAESAKVTASAAPVVKVRPPPKEGGLSQQAGIDALTQAGLDDFNDGQQAATGIGNLINGMRGLGVPPTEPAPHEVLKATEDEVRKMQERNLLPDPPPGKNAVDLFFDLPKEKQAELLAIVRGK